MEGSSPCRFESFTRYDREVWQEILKYHYCYINPWTPALLTLLGITLAAVGFWQLRRADGSWFHTVLSACLFSELSVRCGLATKPHKIPAPWRLPAAALAFGLLWLVTADRSSLLLLVGAMSFFIGVNCFLGRFGSCIKETWDAHIRFFDDRIVNTS